MELSPKEVEKAIKKINNRAATRRPPEKKLRAELSRELPSHKQRRRLRGRGCRLDISQRIS